MISELPIRRAGPDDDAGIRALLAACYPDNVKTRAAYTRWQYWENPFGPARSWIAEDDGEIVAHWAAVPVPMVLAGRPARGAKTADAATLPSHRGRGLYAAIGRQLRADAGAQGLGAVLTHPNPGATRGGEQAGAALIGRAAAHVRPLDDRWLGARLHVPAAAAGMVRRGAFRLADGDRAELTAVLPDDLDDLWALAGRGVANGIARGGPWWRWRYGARPDRPYAFAFTRRGGRLSGAACVTVAERFGARFGLVLEYLAVDESAARGLTSALAATATVQGAVGLALATLPGSAQSVLCTAAGFRRLPRRLEPRPLRMMVLDPANPDARELAARRWTMAWGDLDHL